MVLIRFWEKIWLGIQLQSDQLRSDMLLCQKNWNKYSS